METLTNKRPPLVTVIGWIFIIFSILMILGGVMGLTVYSFMLKAGGGNIPPVSEDMPALFKVISIVFQNFGLLVFLQIIFAVFMLIAGIQFLRLQAWAKTALEAISWLGLAFTIGFGILWVDMVSSLPVKEGTTVPRDMIDVFGAAAGITIMIVWAVPIIVIIRLLRGKTVKEAIL